MSADDDELTPCFDEFRDQIIEVLTPFACGHYRLLE